jgi:hypothetical protein
MKWLHEHQHPATCEKARFIPLDARKSQGLGAILQSVSNRFMIAVGRGEVIRIVGSLSTYSNNEGQFVLLIPPLLIVELFLVVGCQKYAGTKGWECLFKPTSNCTILRSQLRSRQSREQYKAKWSEVNADNTFIPEQFRAKGLYWWWGVIQSYLFRPSDLMQQHINTVEAQIGWGRHMQAWRARGGETSTDNRQTLFRIGLHIRHGDKTEECKWNPHWKCPRVDSTEQVRALGSTSLYAWCMPVHDH